MEAPGNVAAHRLDADMIPAATEEDTVASPRTPGAAIPLASLPNLRDLGGWPTPTGTVSFGKVLRSTALQDLTPDDAKALRGLGIRSIYDLRTAGEITDRPDVVPAGIRFHHLDVLADSSGSDIAETVTALHDPDLARELFSGPDLQEAFISGYREMVTLPSATAAYRQLFVDLLDENNLAALVHCTTGKDRTGWAAALLLLLGVSEDDVFREYLLTNDQLLPHLEPVFDAFAAIGGDPHLLYPVLGVERRYLQASLDEMRAVFGDIGTYFAEGLGIDSGTQDELRRSLTTEA